MKRLRNERPLLSVNSNRNRDLFGGQNEPVEWEERERERADGGGDGLDGVA